MLASLEDCSVDGSEVNVPGNTRYSARRIQVRKDACILCEVNICSVCNGIAIELSLTLGAVRDFHFYYIEPETRPFLKEVGEDILEKSSE